MPLNDPAAYAEPEVFAPAPPPNRWYRETYLQ